MANKKITELTSIVAASVADSDVLPIVDVDASASKKITVANLASRVGISGTPVSLTDLVDGNGLIFNGTSFEPATAVPVSSVAPVGGDVLTYSASTELWTPSKPASPYNFACTTPGPAWATTAGNFSANYTNWQKVLYPQKGCTKIRIRIGVSSGNIWVGYATSNGESPFDEPESVVVTSGSIACPTAGMAEITVSEFDAEVGGFMFYGCDNGTATVYMAVSAGGANTFYEGSYHSNSSNPTVTGDVSAYGFSAVSRVVGMIAY